MEQDGTNSLEFWMRYVGEDNLQTSVIDGS